MRILLNILALTAVLILAAGLVIPLTGTTTAYAQAGQGPYIVVTTKNEYVGAMLYYLTEDYRVPSVNPGGATGSAQSVEPLLHCFTGSYSADLSLPNGTAVHEIAYQIEVLGSTRTDNIVVKDVRTQYVGGPDHALFVDVKVLYPIKQYVSGGAPLVLSPAETVFIYKYVNTTYFELEIRLYYAAYAYLQQPLTTYNITAEFLINMRNWHAYYWYRGGWRNLGYFPLADESLDLTGTLYGVYRNVTMRIDRIIRDKSLLNTLVEQAREAVNSSNPEAVIGLAEKTLGLDISNHYNVTYLGQPVKVDPVQGSAVGPVINVWFPGHPSLQVCPEEKLYNNMESQLEEALTRYIETNDSSLLQKIIAENNAFIQIQADHTLGSTGTLMWVYKDSPLPIAGGDLQVALPAHALGNAPEPDGVSYAILDLSTPPQLNTTDTNITYSNAPPAPLPPAKLGNNSTLVVAIDYRLAYLWMLQDPKAMDPGYRAEALDSLFSELTNSFIKTIYSIGAGNDPVKALKNYRENIEAIIEATAYRIAGETGAEEIMTLINGGQITPPKPAETTITKHPGTGTETQAASTQTTTTTSQESTTSTAGKTVSQPISGPTTSSPLQSSSAVAATTHKSSRYPALLIVIGIAGSAALIIALLVARRRR